MHTSIKFFEEKGQTLIEALIALGVAVAIISAITSVVISSLNNNTFSKNQNAARSYTQQSIEKIRGLVQSNYTTFVNTYTSSIYCIDQDNNFQCTPNGNQCVSTWSGSCNSVKTGIFTREVNFDFSSSDCPNSLEATITVRWSDSKCTDRQKLYCHEASTATCFTNINTVPSPL